MVRRISIELEHLQGVTAGVSARMLCLTLGLVTILVMLPLRSEANLEKGTSASKDLEFRDVCSKAFDFALRLPVDGELNLDLAFSSRVVRRGFLAKDHFKGSFQSWPGGYFNAERIEEGQMLLVDLSWANSQSFDHQLGSLYGSSVPGFLCGVLTKQVRIKQVFEKEDVFPLPDALARRYPCLTLYDPKDPDLSTPQVCLPLENQE